MSLAINPLMLSLSGGAYLIDISTEKTLTYEGTESVTVPAGTYSNADLYTTSTNGVTTSYWVESGIPVPVKIQAPTETDILVGWG
jgi:hypothetical protein